MEEEPAPEAYDLQLHMPCTYDPAMTRRYPRQPRRRSSESFSKADRIYLANRAGWECELCGRDLQNTDPRALSYLIAGHIIARVDGGLPVISNGRAECQACSRAGAAEIRSRRWAERRAQYLEDRRDRWLQQTTLRRPYPDPDPAKLFRRIN